MTETTKPISEERLKLEAQIHAQEARTANATIAEIYQIVSEGKGEPGNWRGAEPVRECIEKLRAELQSLRAETRWIKVEDEMPAESEIVLLCWPGNNYALIDTAWRVPDSDYFELERTAPQDEPIQVSFEMEPLFWRPLPAPPEER